MSIYEAAKDAVKIAQQLDNIELVQKLLDVQEQALEMQERQHVSNKKIDEQARQIQKLTELKKYEFAHGGNWLVDPEHAERKLCPHCTPKNQSPIPLDGYYCRLCKGLYEETN